ncbi:hypothetical protein ACFLZL_05685, partial [Thermodesulfobacteriota bacterium]
MDLKLFDPSISFKLEKIAYAPRPENLTDLKVALVENSKYNSKTILLKIFEILKNRFHMQLAGIHSKQSAGHKVTEDAIKEFKVKAD